MISASHLLLLNYVCRNKRKFADPDECSAICMAMEDVRMVNGLECKMACNSSKVFILRIFNLKLVFVALIFHFLEWKFSNLVSVWQISYVLDTEDFFYRVRRKKRNLSNSGPSQRYQERVQRFHRFLEASV